MSDRRALIRRTVEIDYLHQHRHLPSALSALPIIAGIYRDFDPAHDIFILSKGHACSALYAVLESFGYHPDCSRVHPEIDVANGIENTSGSLGHGLPLGIGMALAKRHLGRSGVVHVLMGDGECLEGTTWESLLTAHRLNLHDRLFVHIDANGFQGSAPTLTMATYFLPQIYPIQWHHYKPGHGVRFCDRWKGQSVHLQTEAEYAAIMAELG